jgi:hypothetical protein
MALAEVGLSAFRESWTASRGLTGFLPGRSERQGCSPK